MANARDWREGVNLIGLTNFISTAIGPNVTICHMKLILVTPLGSKARKLGAFGSYIPTHCWKTWQERNALYSQNLEPWNRECVKSGALEGGLIFRRLRWSTSAGLLLFWADGHRVSSLVGFHAFLSEVENGVKLFRICKTFWSIQTKLTKVFAGNWTLVLWWKKSIPVAQDHLLVMDLELRLPAWILYPE